MSTTFFVPETGHGRDEGGDVDRAARILVLNENPALFTIVREILARDGHEVSAVTDYARVAETIDVLDPDVLVVDPYEGDLPGLDILDEVEAATRPGGPRMVVVTENADIDVAVTAMQRGAADFMLRPLDSDRLRLGVQRAIEQRNLSADQARMRRDLMLNQVGQSLLETLDADKLCVGGINALCVHGGADAAVLLGPEGVLAVRGVAAPQLSNDIFRGPERRCVEFDMRTLGPLSETFAYARGIGLGEARGVLLLYRTVPPSSRAVVDVEFLAGHFSAAVRNLSRYQRARRRARRDHLTGLYNQRALVEAVHQQLVTASEERWPVSLVFIDVDHFKHVNDRYGHIAGSALLVEFTQILVRSLRGKPFAARFGGDEFVVLLPDMSHDAACAVAERLRARIAGHRFLKREGHNVDLTCSLGVATFPDHAQRSKKLLGVADQAMYAAKEAGRNRVGRARDL